LLAAVGRGSSLDRLERDPDLRRLKDDTREPSFRHAKDQCFRFRAHARLRWRTPLVPGDAWVPDDRIKRGKIVVDLVTRKVAAQ
jgi:hypothetical protein